MNSLRPNGPTVPQRGVLNRTVGPLGRKTFVTSTLPQGGALGWANEAPLGQKRATSKSQSEAGPPRRIVLADASGWCGPKIQISGCRSPKRGG